VTGAGLDGVVVGAGFFELVVVGAGLEGVVVQSAQVWGVVVGAGFFELVVVGAGFLVVVVQSSHLLVVVGAGFELVVVGAGLLDVVVVQSSHLLVVVVLTATGVVVVLTATGVVVVLTATGVVVVVVQSPQPELEVVSAPRLSTAAPRPEPTRPSTKSDPFMLTNRDTEQHTDLGVKRGMYDRALAKELYAKRKSGPRRLAEREVRRRSIARGDARRLLYEGQQPTFSRDVGHGCIRSTINRSRTKALRAAMFGRRAPDWACS
jgi:hypothetical protein